MPTSEPLGGPAAASDATSTSEGALGVGVIGTGTISSWHLDSYRNLPSARIVAVCDVRPERAEAAAATYGATAYTSPEALLADPRVEAVSVCTRNDTHADVAVAALEAGRSVLIEKPMATSVADAERIVRAERESAGIAQVGFVRRFSPNAQVLKQFVDAGDLGDVYYAKASCLRRAGNPGGWFAQREISGGGPLIDVGVHFLDIAWWLLGAPSVAAVSGFTFEKLGNRSNITNLSRYMSADYDPSKNDVEDLAGGLIRFTNGAILALDVSYSLHGRDHVGVTIYGDRGGAELEPELRLFEERHDTILETTPQVNSLTFEGVPAFGEEIASFVRAARGEAPSPAPASQGLEITRMVEAVYRSAAEGREIRLDR